MTSLTRLRAIVPGQVLAGMSVRSAWLGHWLALSIVVPILGIASIKAWPEVLGIARAVSASGFRSTAGLAAFLAIASVVWLSRRRTPFSPASFVVITTVAGGYLRFFYVISVEPEWTSDFLTYWVVATGQVASGDFTATDFYTERTLPILVPLILLTGAKEIHVALANVMMLALVQLAGYDILRRAVSHQAAQSFTLAFLLAPIPYFASTITSHDLWAMWLLMMALWLSSTALSGGSRRRQQLTIAMGVPLALLCLVLEIQRGVGTLLALSLAISAFIWWLGTRCSTHGAAAQSRLFTIVCVGVLIAQIPFGAAADHFDLRAAQSPQHKAHLTAYYASNGTSIGDGTWGWMRDFRGKFTDHLQAGDTERLEAFSRSIILSDWAVQPGRRIANAAERMSGLFELDNSNFWYFEGVNPALHRPLQWLRAYSGVFSVGFSALFLLSLARMVFGAMPSFPVLAGLILTSLVVLALGSFSENQPRYILWLWPVGLMLIAEGLARRTGPPLSLKGGGIIVVAVTFGWAVLLLSLWLPVQAFYREVDGRMLSGWHRSGTSEPVERLPHRPGANAARLAFELLPGPHDSVERELCLAEQGPQGLTFYFAGNGTSAGDSLQVSFGGAHRHVEALGSASGQVHEVRIPALGPPTECGTLRFELVPGTPDIASSVDVYFVRLE